MLFVLTTVMLLMTGCIRENMDDCKGKVTLRFRYVGDGTTDIFAEKIDKVTMYVYSAADGSLAGVFEYDEKALDAYQGANIELYPGNYQIVCWGNAFENSTIHEGDRIAAPGHFDNTEIDTNDPLYYGTTDIAIPETLVEQDYVCQFVCSHIKVNVRLEGFVGAWTTQTSLQSRAQIDNVELAMTRLPSYTDFDNIPADDHHSTYYPTLQTDENDDTSFVTQFNTMRFKDDNDIMLQLLSGPERTVIQEFSLAEFMSTYGISVENRNEILIPILIRASTAGIEIAEWEQKPVTPGFDKDN